MDECVKDLEKKLAELERQKAENDKRLLVLEWVIGILSCLVLFMPILIASFVPLGDREATLLVFSGLVPSFVGFGFAVWIEQIAGYYKCKHCGHRHIPAYKDVVFAPHVGRTRSLKCPACGKKSWQKKVLGNSAPENEG